MTERIEVKHVAHTMEQNTDNQTNHATMQRVKTTQNITRANVKVIQMHAHKPTAYAMHRIKMKRGDAEQNACKQHLQNQTDESTIR